MVSTLVCPQQNVFRTGAETYCVPADDFFLPVLKDQGYCGAYFCKPCSPAEQYGAPCDGCALFYRSSRFDVCTEPQGKASLTCYSSRILSSMCGVVCNIHVVCNIQSLQACVSLCLFGFRTSVTCCAGHTYASLHGEGGNQGMLRVCLLDKQSSQVLLVVNTHLKAKAGSANDAIREHQVGTHTCLLWYVPSGPWAATYHYSTGSQTAAVAAYVSFSSFMKTDAVVRTPHDLLQAEQLLEEVQQAVNSMSVSASTAGSFGLAAQQHRQSPPLVIICGDLNTTPDSTTCQVPYVDFFLAWGCACCSANTAFKAVTSLMLDWKAWCWFVFAYATNCPLSDQDLAMILLHPGRFNVYCKAEAPGPPSPNFLACSCITWLVLNGRLHSSILYIVCSC